MDQTVRFFKLVSGENIIGSTETNCEDLDVVSIVKIDNPVLVNSVRFPKGNMIYESFVMQPFIALSLQKNVDILSRHVIFTTEVKETVKDQYLDYLSKDSTAEMSSLEEDELHDDQSLLDFLNEEPEEEYYGGEEDENPTFH